MIFEEGFTGKNTNTLKIALFSPPSSKNNTFAIDGIESITDGNGKVIVLIH